MKYAVWGAGHRGEIIHRILGEDVISCFIDLNPEKCGKTFLGKPVISYENYKSSGLDDIVVVSPFMSADIEKLLDTDGIPYFLQDECPPEFMGFGLLTAEKYWDSLLDRIDDHSALYGISLYTVWLLGKLMEKGKNDVVLVSQDSVRKPLLARIANELEDSKLMSLTQAKADGRKVYICFYDELLNDRNRPPSSIDLFDLSKDIIPYRNARIGKFKDSHKGEMCFIVATGPSLRIEDLNTLERNGVFCMSMNSIFHAFDKTSWRPDCYCVSDGLYLDLIKDAIFDIPVKNIFIGDSVVHIDYDSLPDRFYPFHVVTGRFFRTNARVSEDIADKAYPSNTITNVCIQLAMYMGFSEVYLLGVDFNYKSGNSNHFYSGADSNEQNFSKSQVSEVAAWMLNGYKAMSAYADSHGIRIYNATRGGALEVFERVYFDSLF